MCMYIMCIYIYIERERDVICARPPTAFVSFRTGSGQTESSQERRDFP